MKPGLKTGDHYAFSIQVREDMQPRFEETLIHPLYSTAAMLNHMEWAARQHLLPYLEADEESVGYHIDLKHVAATPIGATVTIHSTVTQVGRAKVVSRVEAWHQGNKVGEGTLTQALVSKSKLYGATAASTPESPDDNLDVPPAELVSLDGKSGLGFEILKWETGQFPCTRYDEWLICELTVLSNGQKQTFKGPFLLRHEIEEWLEAAIKLDDGTGTGFRSDFLEPVLQIEMAAGEPGEYQCRLQIRESESSPQGRQRGLSLTLDVNQALLTHFARQLATQLDGFPSRL